MAAFIPGASPPAVRIAIRRGREPDKPEDSLLPFMEMGSDARVVHYRIYRAGRGEPTSDATAWPHAKRRRRLPRLSGQPRGLHAFERSPGLFRGVADGGAGAVGRLSVVIDGGDFIAERLVGARHVDLGPGVSGAGRERILVVSERLGEVAGGKSVAAALAGNFLHAFVAAARRGRRNAGCVAWILIHLEGFELLLLLLDLLLLLLNQPLGGVDLIAHASSTDESEDAERERKQDSRCQVCHGYEDYVGAGFVSHRHQYWRIVAPCQCRSARRPRPHGGSLRFNRVIFRPV